MILFFRKYKRRKGVFLALAFLAFSFFPTKAQSAFSTSPPILRISQKLKDKYPDDSVRALVIYKWINKKIKYDHKSFLSYRFPAYNSSPAKVLKKKKALCSGLSLLYEEMCKASGIPALTLSGYVMTPEVHEGQKLYYHDHAWNLVKIGNRWGAVDITWDNGQVRQRKRLLASWLARWFHFPIVYNKYKYVHSPSLRFFDVDPTKFVQIHLPVWDKAQLLENSVSLREFEDTSPERAANLAAKELSTDHAALNSFASTSKDNQLMALAVASRYSNERNDLCKASHYYQVFLMRCPPYKNKELQDRLRKNNTLVDSIRLYGKLFLQDNKRVMAEKHAFLAKENKVLFSSIHSLEKRNGKYLRSTLSAYRITKQLLKTMAIKKPRGEYHYLHRLLHKKYKCVADSLKGKLLISIQRNNALGDSLNKLICQSNKTLHAQKENWSLQYEKLAKLCGRKEWEEKVALSLDAHFNYSEYVLPYYQEADSLYVHFALGYDSIMRFESKLYPTYFRDKKRRLSIQFRAYCKNYQAARSLCLAEEENPYLGRAADCVAQLDSMHDDFVEYKTRLLIHKKYLTSNMKGESKILEKASMHRVSVHRARLREEKRRFYSYDAIVKGWMSNVKGY